MQRPAFVTFWADVLFFSKMRFCRHDLLGGTIKMMKKSLVVGPQYSDEDDFGRVFSSGSNGICIWTRRYQRAVSLLIGCTGWKSQDI